MIRSRGTEAYRRLEAQSRSPLELVVMLYDGALRFTNEARDAQARGDRRARAHAVSRAMAIVAELQNTLDIERGGEVGHELDRLYAYLTTRMLDVSTKGDATALDEISRLLATVRDGWSTLVSPEAARSSQ